MRKSFLKWAGGKSALFPQIMALVPPDERKGTFIEPFVGSGVVSLNAPFQELIINDTNASVMAVWNQLKTNSKLFIDSCETHFSAGHNTEAMFYEKRALFNKTDAKEFPFTNAILFIYLNRHCFNGLCRFNAKGEFNVPFGRYTKPYFPREELEAAAEVMKRTTAYQLDFADVMNMAEEGDVVYCDPPYLPISDTSNFTAYSTGGFSIEDQWRLVARAERLRDRGVTVIISNNDVPLAWKMYSGADHIHKHQVAKRISCKADGRKKSGEVMAVYRP